MAIWKIHKENIKIDIEKVSCENGTQPRETVALHHVKRRALVLHTQPSSSAAGVVDG
jgi:hypothetical protein